MWIFPRRCPGAEIEESRAGCQIELTSSLSSKSVAQGSLEGEVDLHLDINYFFFVIHFVHFFSRQQHGEKCTSIFIFLRNPSCQTNKTLLFDLICVIMSINL